jgi:hypothetical protein
MKLDSSGIQKLHNKPFRVDALSSSNEANAWSRLRESGFGIEFVVPGVEHDLLARTGKPHFLALYNDDLPRAVGSDASGRCYVITRLVEILVQSRIAALVLFFVILHFVQLLDGVDRTGRYCETERAGTTGF